MIIYYQRKIDKFLDKLSNIYLGLDNDIAKFLGYFGIYSYPLKFYLWGRKIEENVEFFKNNNREKDIIPYLKKCYFWRRKFKKIAENDFPHYTKKVNFYFEQYKIC